MPINVNWYNNTKTIILWHVQRTWSLDDFYAAHAETMKLLEDQSECVSTIVDATSVTQRPTGNLIRHFQKVLKITPLDTVIYVRSEQNWQFIEMLINMVIRITPGMSVKRVLFATSVEEALAILTEQQAV